MYCLQLLGWHAVQQYMQRYVIPSMPHAVCASPEISGTVLVEPDVMLHVIVLYVSWDSLEVLIEPDAAYTCCLSAPAGS